MSLKPELIFWPEVLKLVLILKQDTLCILALFAYLYFIVGIDFKNWV